MFHFLLIMFNTDDEVMIESMGGWAVDTFALDQEPTLCLLMYTKQRKEERRSYHFSVSSAYTRKSTKLSLIEAYLRVCHAKVVRWLRSSSST